MTAGPTEGRVEAAGGVRLAYEWFPGDPLVVGLPGLSAHRGAFTPIAERLSPRCGLVSFDLRGRGDADHPNGPFGMEQHANDVQAALLNLGISGPVILAGHSMGAYVATAFTRLFPARVRAVIMIDSGWGLYTPGLDPDQLWGLALAPIFARTGRAFDSREDFLAASAPMIAASSSDPVTLRYILNDVEQRADGKFYSKCSEFACRADWSELITQEQSYRNIESVKVPMLVLLAERGLYDAPQRMMPDAVVAGIRQRVPDVTVELLPDSNHTSIIGTTTGVDWIAAQIEGFLTAKGLTNPQVC